MRGELAELIRNHDWAATVLGPRDAWPRSLRNYASMICELPSAASVFWGPELIQIYNDGYAVIMGPRHPRHLGSPFRECWPEAYDAILPLMRQVLERGEPVSVDRNLFELTRFGFVEEAYFTFSFSPLRDDEGAVAGVLQLVTEMTDAVLLERRASALHALSNQTMHATSHGGAPGAAATAAATRRAVEVLAGHADLPYIAVHVVDPLDHTLARSAWTGTPPDGALPEPARAIEAHALVTTEHGFAAPIAAADQSVVAVLVGALSPRLRFDAAYRRFVELVAGQLATLLATARARDDERRRVEALSEIDRAKTEFFNNVSHELRTPLTLILGPVEDALQGAAGLRGEVLEAVHRNALRLLRLVNTLLDFARLEANRLSASFEATDLPTLTAGLAGSFQSLLESNGLTLRVDCPAIDAPVYVDSAQWEKIVLNLVSNAFKFTFEGEIAVRLHERDGLLHLEVSDTGTGIPADELPAIFDRFHRVKNARGRSYEGTGIGLALVKELTALHGGTVRVESVVGEGTTFHVSIPKRTAPPGDEAPVPAPSPASIRALARSTPFTLEAAQWSEHPAASDDDDAPDAAAAAASAGAGAARERILVVDDNADMRAYLARLLAPRWTVEVAEDGQAGLDAALRHPPDLVLSDVMMPRLSGPAMVAALRAEPATHTLPILLLSARAGEEAVVGAFETGADDYLVKPFSARELLARVNAHLAMARLRRAWARELESANHELEAFSYSVSHDLRAPLRAIDGFSQALAADYADRLDDEGRRYLDRVRAGTRRMGLLIDDLLALSRITRAPLVRERVDVGAAARRVLAELAEHDPERAVETHVADGLVARADPRLLAVLLTNLLGNAWKFSSKQPHARIDVGREEHGGGGGEVVFFVRDNGAGFSMEYAKKLFAPFQRLHTEAQFEGTGIGLATVQRIVSRHGGRVWADAAPDRGATFYFTLGEG